MQSSAGRSWFITQRWQLYEGEARANLLRIIAVGTFYIIHLLHYFAGESGFLEFGDGPAVTDRFHLLVTLLAVTWTMLSVGILLCLRNRIFPWWLPYFSTCCDIVLLTSVLYLANGPKSPLIVGYFLLIALAALRFSLPLVRLATVGSVLGYICLLGCAKWPETFGLGQADIRVPRYHQLIVLAAIALCGIMLGQVIRRIGRIFQEYAERSADADAITP
jgi:hypothetical protein